MKKPNANVIANSQMLAIQNIHKSDSVKVKLVERGYNSSLKIFHKPEHEFIEDVKGIMSEEEAKLAYKKAKRNYVMMSNLAAAYSTTYGSQAYRALNRRSSENARQSENGEQNLFENIPSYQEIFGGLDYCECPNCKSIFGPAAYFTDLMRIAKKHIVLEDKAVPLTERRNDLFNMKLSCENTNNIKPYLQIVNEIIETSIKNDNLYSDLNTMYYPFNLPFCLPMEKLRIKFQKAGVKNEAFFKAWNLPAKTVAVHGMSITHELFDVLCKPLEDLKKFYGQEINIKQFSNLPEFLKITGLTRNELNNIFLQDIDETDPKIKKTLLHNLFINQKLDGENSLEITNDEIINLNNDTLDRICRFIRIARILNLGYAETDWLIKTAGADSNGNIPLLSVWNIYDFANRTGIDIYTASALMRQIKDYGNDPFKQIFGYSRKELEAFSVSNTEQIIAKTLKADIYSLRKLREYLKQAETINVDEIYRHCKMASLISLDIEPYIELLNQLFKDTVKTFTIEQAELLFEMKINLRSNSWEANASPGFTLDDFHKKVEFMRKNYDPKNYDEQALESGVYAELADFFGYSVQETISLFSCVLNDEQLKKWPIDVLTAHDITSLDDTVNKFSKFLLIAKTGISIDLISCAVKNKKYFELEPENLILQNFADLSSFQGFFELFSDDSHKLLKFVDEYAQDNRNIKTLAEITGWDESKLNDIMNTLYPENSERNVVKLISKLDECTYLQNKLSLDKELIDTLLLIAKDTEKYSDLCEAVEKLCGTMDDSAKMTLEAKKRDAILPLAMLNLGEKYVDITNNNKLYKYFLIDVEMDDKTTISPIKEGINALQLYLQRCRMNLEQGIKEITIPETWWSWMMDYRVWEANREIFVYPENYLLPSVRQSKTQLFKDTEDALQQAKITDGYIEEQYVKYLDDYFQLTQLKICGAYETTVDYVNVLYLFARSRQSPYAYYYCKRVSSLAWSEWEKIDTNIDSGNITPVFVFNRLHIFWSTVTENAKTNVETTAADKQLNAGNQKTYTLQIKYTYLNLQDKWITSQTLSEGSVVLAEDDKQDSTAKSIRKTVDDFGINVSDNSFDKLTLLRLNRSNFDGFVNKDKDYECLAVITGSFAKNLNEMAAQIENSTLDKEQNSFTDALNCIIESNNFQVNASGSGYFSTGYFKIFNEDLEEERILHKNEFYIIDGYIPTKNSLIYTISHDEIHQAVGAYLSQSILRDSVLPAKGILPYQNNAKSPARPKMNENSFVIYSGKDKNGAPIQVISPACSKEIFNKLKNEEYIDKNNFADEKMLKNLDLYDCLASFMADKNNPLKSNYILEIQQILLKNIGAVYLFENAGNAQVIPVVNQPGKFIYDSGGEAFLLYPVYYSNNNYLPLDIQKIDAGTTVGVPITAFTFVRLGFDLQNSRNILQGLKTARLANENGIVNISGCTRDELGKALKNIVTDSKALDAIYVTILNLPFISENEFKSITGIVADVVDTLKAGKILYEIKENSKIYQIDISMLKKNNQVLFTNQGKGILNDQSVSEIYKKLEAAVSSVNFNYRINADLPKEFKALKFSEWKFGVQRLTNHTLKKLKRKLETGGIGAFLNRKTQGEQNPAIMPFSRLEPTDNIIQPTVKDGAQIDFEGLYAEYNWELFYHIPFLIAKCFETNAMHEDCMKWFHYIFNPTMPKDDLVPKNYWNFLPFTYDDKRTFEDMLKDPSAIQAYNDSPFNPHAIARLRIGAYGKYTVMEYIDNIIQWADRQFTLNTWESLTTATMLYVWANDLLGPKPQAVSQFERKEDKSFKDIEDFYSSGDIPQFIIDFEEKIQELQRNHDFIPISDDVPFNDIRAYFGVPENSQILGMWDIVEDRLYKIRNSLDINGAPRITALFEKPIDPLALAKAAAASGFSSPAELNRKPTLYPYRFSYMIEKAKSLTSLLIQLGNSISAALEKNDAESLLLTVNTQEQSVLNMTTSIKESQLKEAEENIAALTASKESALTRKEFYRINAEGYISDKESASLITGAAAAALQAVGGATKFAAGVAHLAPQVGSPFAMKYGGAEIGKSLEGFAEGYNALAGIMAYSSGVTLTMAQYDRRRDEWNLQKSIAEKEAESLDKQIEAATLRKKAAERELEIHLKTIEHKTEVLNYLKKKFTGAQLYQWLIGKLSSTMWQAYQLALELAMSAQDSYQFERDEADAFIKFDYWENSFKGLMAGEQLMLALEQMQQSYQKKNSRRLEIEKNISMQHAFPNELNQLKEAGVCEFEFSEKLFAKDYPGCYRRKIASVALSIPAVLPPYETIKAILKQNSSQILLKPSKDGIDYLFDPPKEPPKDYSVKDASRFGEKIAVSKGISDNGMFSLSFNDERYLPFEGTGVDSKWRLEMPKDSNGFDFSTISDIIITMQYTALEDENRGSESFYGYVISKLK
jgi:hypothetical protein